MLAVVTRCCKVIMNSPVGAYRFIHQYSNVRVRQGIQTEEPGLLTPEDGTDRLSRKVGEKLPYSLHNNPEERSSQKHGVFPPPGVASEI
jgi:hypothetical protein